MAVPMIAGRPSGLMTDLIGDPGLVSCGQMVEIRSSSPRFTWIVPGEGMQQKYRIILGESGKGVLWDSGVVESTEIVPVAPL